MSAIWAEVLGKAPIGIQDNFFALGGHSLTAMQLLARLERMFHIDLPLADLFAHPTVAELVAQMRCIQSRNASAEAMGIERQPRSALTPLSFAQERMWFIRQLQPDSAAYNTYLAIRLHGPLDIATLEQSLQAIVRQHAVLRTTIQVEHGQPKQLVLPELALPVTHVNLLAVPAAERETELQRLATAAIQRPFDLTHGPLLHVVCYQLAPREHVLLFTAHHIAADAWGLDLILQEFVAQYDSLHTGRPSPLPEPAIDYIDYALWHRTWSQGEAVDRQLAYWRQQLRGVPALALMTDRPRPVIQTTRGAIMRMKPTPAMLDALRAFSQREGTTLFMTLMAAFEVLLYRYTGQVDFALGMPAANRQRIETERLVGTLMNTLVVRADLSGAPTFRELLQRVRTAALEAYAHQDVPFERLVAELQPTRDLSHTPLFQVICNGITTPLPKIEIFDLTWEPFDVDSQTAQADLALTIADLAYQQDIWIEYNTDLYEPDTIARMLAQYQVLLQSVLSDPEVSIARLPLLPEAERNQLLYGWNDTAADYRRDACLHELFEAQAARTPDAVAVVYADRSITYRALNQRADQLAAYLRQAGIGPDQFVGICLERSIEMVVGLLAILKAGGAYLPLDPAFPVERLAYMMADAQAPLLLTQTGLLPQLIEELSAQQLEVLYIDAQWPKIAAAAAALGQPGQRRATPDNLAYIIYTSGSTGKPKGVQLEHRGVVNMLAAVGKQPGLTAQDVMLAVTTLSFDISVVEVFLPLITGAYTVIVSQAIAADGQQLARQIAATGATIMQATPATWRMLLASGWQGSPCLKVICGGEAMSVDLAQALLARVGSLWNLYGPTETTVWSTLAQVTSTEQAIPIGRPLANTQLYILDGYGEPAPIGVVGELYIGGDGVARGYLNRPELNAEKFLRDPFRGSVGARMYRTGDLARYRADGQVEFLGRIDHQVKVRGFRIELGEIEAVLAQHQAVAQAVVTARDDESGSKYLAAYVIPAPQRQLDQSELRRYLLAQLPNYMVPTAYVVLEAFPLTPNGKVDRKRLPNPAQMAASAGPTYLAPRTALEQQLTQIWEYVLGRQPIGIGDNFFEIGGHSLAAARLFVQIETLLGRTLPLATLFQAPTIEQLARIMGDEDWESPWSCLVPIQPGGSRPPFFCVHGFGGDVVGYFDLAQQLGTDQPFYGLQAQGLNGLDAPHTTIEAMAAHYVKAVRTLQPTGPYHLGGYCYGGVVAYEMARQLEAQGERVNLVAILEGYALDRSEARKQFWQPKVMLSFVRNLPYWVNDHLRPSGWSHIGLSGVWNGRSQRDLSEEEVRDWDDATLRASWEELDEHAVDGDTPRRRVRLAHERAIAAYHPQPYGGRVALFRVRAMSLFRAYDPAMGWARFAQKGVEVRIIAGTHYNILEQPYVVDLAAQLKDCLNRTGKGGRHAALLFAYSVAHALFLLTSAL